MERVPELAFICNEIDDYLKDHHRIFNQQLVEADAEVYSKTLGQATRDQCKRGKSNNMSKRVKTMMAIPTETADLSQ